MPPIAIGVIVFACIFGGALIGMLLSAALPEHHRSPESKDVVRLGMGIIATMTALILGLVTASAKSAFDTQDTAVKHVAANVFMLDRMLARYGPETKEVRELLRRAVVFAVDNIWPEDSSRPAGFAAPERTAVLEGIEDRIRELSPQTDAQRWFRSSALELSSDALQTRWLAFGGAVSSVSLPFLVVMVFWLTVIFGSFGLFAPRNATVIAVLFVCALSVAASIFLILEMDQPFEGMIRISSAPLRYTLSHLGQ